VQIVIFVAAAEVLSVVNVAHELNRYQHLLKLTSPRSDDSDGIKASPDSKMI
jgi:hypothetical protein